MDGKLAALYDLGQKLLLLQDSKQISETVLDIADDVLDFGDSEFLLADDATGELWVAAHRGDLEVAAGLRLPLDGDRGITVAAARSGEPLYVPDVRRDRRYVDAGLPAISELAVPVQFEGRVLGVINVESEIADAYTPSDVQLLSILASQAALALQNARVHAQERRRADEMAVINQVARRVSATLDLRQTLDGIVEAAAELVPSVLAEISLWDEQERTLTLQALRCEPERAYPIGRTYPPGKGYTGWVVHQRHPLLVDDVDARDDIKPDLLPGEQGFKSYVGVPLLAGDELIGTLVLIHDRAGAFDAEDLELLEGLAGQAAVAIRNASLYEELARRHRELTALNAVAAAMNQVLDLETLLADAVRRVMQCLGADGGGIRLLDPASGQLTLSFTEGMSEAYVAAVKQLRLGKGIVGDVALTGESALVADMQQDRRLLPGVLPRLREEGLRSLAVVPLRSREKVVGTLGVVSRAPGAFAKADLDLLTAMGHQVGVAIERERLHKDLAQRARELEAVHAVAAAVNRPGDLELILDKGLEQALAVTGFAKGAIALRDPDSGMLHLCCHRGMSAGFVTWLGERMRQKSQEAWPEGRGIDIEGVPGGWAGVPKPVREEGIQLSADAPLFAEGELVGLLSVATRQKSCLTAEQESLLQAIGHQLGTAIANARLRQEALDAERLAAVGRVAASVAHELRSPLGGIKRSAEFLARPELSEATRGKLSRAIVAMAGRLVTTTQELLDYCKGGRMALAPTLCSLPGFLDEMLEVLRVDFSDRGIEVQTVWGYEGDVWMDADRMAQVVYNIAANARDAMPDGGQLRVTTRRVGQWVELCFSDTGPGVPPGLGERIFEPFTSYGKRQGAGLGLAIARRIVREHGGEICLDRQSEEGAVFLVRLPLGERQSQA